MSTTLRRGAARALALLAPFVAAGCISKDSAQKAVESISSAATPLPPDVLPRMKNATLPFQYPRALYEQKVQGNVTLRIYIDRIGNVHPDSTRITASSGYPSLDSAAITGARDLVFEPARRKNDSVAVAILFPVQFRHPDAAPMPGDSVKK